MSLFEASHDLRRIAASHHLGKLSRRGARECWQAEEKNRSCRLVFGVAPPSFNERLRTGEQLRLERTSGERVLESPEQRQDSEGVEALNCYTPALEE